jgi:uncharacterized membrane protein YebE (DUF533 family)
MHVEPESMTSTSIFSKGKKIELDAILAAKHGRLALPRIPPVTTTSSQSARNSYKESSINPHRTLDEDSLYGAHNSRRVRKETLDTLEERWKTREVPKQRSAKENSIPEAIQDVRSAVLSRCDGHTDPSMVEQPTTTAPQSRGSQSRAVSPQDLEQDAEMAELKALMAANDLEAAEAKLQRIIEVAQEDGHIDEDEQRQIDEAKVEVSAMRRRQEDQHRAFETAAAKAAEQAALQALLVSNDVAAAERKLGEIIAAAEEDGHIDEEEQRQIDEARKELEKLQVRLDSTLMLLR